MNFYHTSLVIVTVNCGGFLQHTLSNFDGILWCFIKGLGLRKLDSDFLNMILKYYFFIESYRESFSYIYIAPNNFIITCMRT